MQLKRGKTDMVIYASNSTTWEEKQADLCDFEASLLFLYIVRFRLLRA